MSDEPKVISKNKLNKKILIGIAVFIAVALVVALVIFVPKVANARKLEEQLSLGDKYLSELKYEQAVAAYLAAIEIDPKNVDAYLGLADVYIAQGEYEKAEEILEDALDELDDEEDNAGAEINKKLEEVETVRKQNEIVETPVPTETSTPVPTEMSTPVPTATSTPVPTATSTPVPTATSTPTPESIVTSAPEPTVTSTPVPTATSTPEPTATSTPEPTATSTPIPTPTSIPLPENFVSWENADTEDEVMVWQDIVLEAKIRKLTEIEVGDIMLSDVWEITELDLENLYWDERIVNISALEKMKNLTVVNLAGNSVTDLDPLKELPYLKELVLDYMEIDVAALEGFHNLLILSLNGCGVHDFGFISKLPHLKKLSAMDEDDRPSLDYAPLLNAKTLTSLDFSYVHAKASNLLEIVGQMTWLEELNLSGCYIEDISMLGGLVKLKYLNLSGNSITDFTVLDKLRNLETLILGFDQDYYMGMWSAKNTLLDTGVLRNLTGLKKLSLDFCSVEDISGLKNLINLEELHLEENNVEDFSVLVELPALRNLYLSGFTSEVVNFLADKSSIKHIEWRMYELSIVVYDGLVKKDGVVYDAEQKKVLGVAPDFDLQKFSIPEGVTYLYSSALCNCKTLTELTIPSTLKEIYGWGSVFEGCDNLTEVHVDEDNGYFTAENGLLMNKGKSEIIAIAPGLEQIVVPESITEGISGLGACQKVKKLIINSAEAWGWRYDISACSSLQEIILCEDFKDYAVENGVIYNSDKTEILAVAPGVNAVVIPDTVIEIDLDAFENCINLEYLYISKNVDGYELNQMSLEDCEKLTYIDVDVENEYYVFKNGVLYGDSGSRLLWMNKAVGTLYVEQAVNSIDTDICKYVKEFVVDSSNERFTTDGTMLFTENGTRVYLIAGRVKEAVIPERVTRISSWVLESYNELEQLYVPDSVTEIDLDENDFKNRNLVLIVPSGSYAEQFAMENNIPVVTQ